LTCSCTSNSIEQYAPSDQLKFHRIYKTYSSTYKNGANDIVKSKIFNDILSERYAFFYAREFKIENWIGHIKKIETPKGGGYVTAEIKADFDGMEIIYTNLGYISEHVERIFDSSKRDSDAVQGGQVYNQLAQMREGERVIFSAKVSRKVNSDYGVFEMQDVKYPKIAVQFTDIRPFSGAAQQLKAQEQWEEVGQLDDESIMQSRFGNLRIVKSGDRALSGSNNVEFKGKKLITIEEPIVSFCKLYNLQDSDAILLLQSGGGNACPATFRFISIKSDSTASVTKEFGNCSDIPFSKKVGERISVRFPGDPSETIIYENGRIKKAR
jgi:hypothetical protein